MNETRVVRVITRLNIGGPAIQAIDLSRELRSMGFDSYLIHGQLSAGEGDMTTLLPTGDTATLYLDDLRRPISPIHDLRAWWRTYRTLCRLKPDIVHTHTAKAGAVGRLAAVAYNKTVGAKRPARLVHTYHGHVFEGYFGSPSTRVFLSVERWLGRRTDAIIAISPLIGHDLLHTYFIGDQGRIRVIPLGFNLDRLAAITSDDRHRARAELQVPDGWRVVTTVGRLTGIKQHALFLDMAARLAATDERLLFLIVGDGELRPALEAQAVSSGLSSRVRFLGWRGDLEKIYGATDVFVLTSRNEGTPVALIEAMASGVASVSTDVGGVRNVITNPSEGAVVPYGDVQALSDNVRRFVTSAQTRDAVGRAARSSVLQRFDLRRLVKDIDGLYRQLVNAS